MIDVSIAAAKARGVREDKYAPLEFSNEGPPKNAGKALLSDAQNSFLGSVCCWPACPRRSGARDDGQYQGLRNMKCEESITMLMLHIGKDSK
jgi:hypothetical protein